MNSTKTVHALSLLIVGIGIGVNGYSQSFLTNGLVAYYPFNGDANDASGNGNNGINHNAILTMDRFGSPSSAYDFNGTSSYMVIPQNSVLNSLTTNFTLSAWIWARGMSDTVEIIAKASSGFPDGWLFDSVINCTPNVHQLRLAGAAPGGGCDHPMGVTDYSLMQWHHVVATVSGTVAELYLDGVLDGAGNAGNIPLNTLDIWIGSGHPSSTDPVQHYWFNGMIDDVRIYNRALTTNEVQQLYVYESGPRVDLIKAVKPSFKNLTLTTNYQLQVSGDVKTWTNQGSPFTATNINMVYPQYFDVDNWNSLYFRLKTSP